MLAAAWLLSYAFTWLGEEDELIVPLPQHASDGAKPALPHGHPPVPSGVRSLCASGLDAAAKAASQSRPYLESPYAVAAVSVVASVLTGVRRWRIERARWAAATSGRPENGEMASFGVRVGGWF